MVTGLKAFHFTNNSKNGESRNKTQRETREIKEHLSRLNQSLKLYEFYFVLLIKSQSYS